MLISGKNRNVIDGGGDMVHERGKELCGRIGHIQEADPRMLGPQSDTTRTQGATKEAHYNQPDTSRQQRHQLSRLM